MAMISSCNVRSGVVMTLEPSTTLLFLVIELDALLKGVLGTIEFCQKLVKVSVLLRRIQDVGKIGLCSW